MSWQPIKTAPTEGQFLVWDGEGIELGERGHNGAILVANDPAPHTIFGAILWHPLPAEPNA